MNCKENNCLSDTAARSDAEFEEDDGASIFRVQVSRVRMQPYMLTQATSDSILSMLLCKPYRRSFEKSKFHLHNFMVPKPQILQSEKFSPLKTEILNISLVFEKAVAQLLCY